ncbi:hypothetical protein ABMA28_015675 [Loxostege sticticalis]|uniref:Uncharacterized protein n=1 Tax=Loxostege sticticalis TaxID=481309 RepID=A0ABD0TAK5_LOXSC
MILTGLAVFLFGTAVSAGPFIPHVKAPTEIVISKHSSVDKITEYYPSMAGSPFISNFIQKGTNVFFKPQFMLSAAQMPPQIQTLIAAIEKDDCKTNLPIGPPPMLMEEPLRVVQQEIVASSNPIVKEVIEINPVEYEYNQHGQPIVELTPVLETHVLELPKLPVAVEESAEERVVIPLAPEFPPLELPKLPILVEEMSPTPVQAVPETPVVVEIPPAPVLPPLDEMPKLPVLVEEPEVVEVSVKPQEIPQLSVDPSLIPETYVREVVISPPEAPVLPPFEVPKPVMIEENFVYQPIEIPTAPTLPPFEMPKLSVVVEEANVVVPCPPGEETHEINIQHEAIPEAPVLPSYVPELTEIVMEDKPVVIPQPPKEIKIVEEIMLTIPEAPVLPTYIPVDIPKPFLIEEPASVIVENEIVEPVVIPVAPVLPPFEMPELPVVIEEPSMVLYPSNKVHISPPVVPEVVVSPPNQVVFEEKPIVIPEAPVLPPLSLPELPVVEVEEKVVPCDHVAVVEPVVIPEAPVLAPYVPSEMPTPVHVEEPVAVEAQKPVVIPSAPVLPPLELPESPVIVEETVAPCPPEKELEHTKVVMESRPIVMPTYAVPESSLSDAYVSNPIILSSAPQFLVPYFPVMTEKLMKEEPTSCVHDIVVERILPKLEKSLPKAARAPVSAYLTPLRYALY